MKSKYLAEHRERGRTQRESNPRSGHGDWSAAADRPDPVDLIESQNTDRIQWLVPIRRARMVETPFTFYRGAAKIMASDLASNASPDLQVQLCGDAHLSNFGVFGSPERSLLFDLNDFDETLPGPFDWDVKRLAASFVIAAEDREWDVDTGRNLAMEVTRAYRKSMATFAEQSWLETWYGHVSMADMLELAEVQGAKKKSVKRGRRFIKKAKSKDHLQAARKLVEIENGSFRFRSAPPLLIPLRDVPREEHPEQLRQAVDAFYNDYRATIGDDIASLLNRYDLVDMAVKVVGVGSVGTRCLIALFVGRGPKDVLLIQIKEATQSVLEDHLPPSRYDESGRRVVEGQRLLQAASDMFLGWSTSSLSGNHFYLRQLKDWKGSVDVEKSPRESLAYYARMCGLILARGHAVSGDPAAISGYLGKGNVFDEAMAEFGVRYARQNREDHAAFAAAIEDGRLEAAELPS